VFLTALKLLNFKNYGNASFSFTKKFVLINGNNGSGKTNLVDSVYYLCLCRSYFTRSDNLSARHNHQFFRLDGTFSSGNDTDTITCKFQNGKKEFFRNEVIYDRLSDHVGLIPVVMVAPDDIAIINGGSEERRRFLDAFIAQLDHEYLRQLLVYNKVLQQRNAALRVFSEERRVDDALLGILNNQLAQAGNFIFEARKNYLRTFELNFAKYYLQLCGNAEVPAVQYDSQLEQGDLLHLLMNNVKIDLEAQRTTFGIHRDDILFSLDNYLLKDTGSQGQVKSFLIALKLAQYAMIMNATGKKPVLLLDDVFEKLDKARLHVLFTILCDETFEQIFITDADEKRSSGFFNELGIDYDHVTIEKEKLDNFKYAAQKG